MQPTVIRFRGALTPEVLTRAGGLTLTLDRGDIVLSGTISPANLRGLIDVLLATDQLLVDVSGARPDCDVS